nr:lipoprotein [Lysinibacillus timonensis]
MKRIFHLLLLILLVVVLAACSSSETNQGAASSTFTGTIEEIVEHSALVSIDEGDILRSGSSVYVNLSVNNTEAFQVGDHIKVTYDGQVRESSPLGITTLSVELVE